MAKKTASKAPKAAASSAVPPVVPSTGSGGSTEAEGMTGQSSAAASVPDVEKPGEVSDSFPPQALLSKVDPETEREINERLQREEDEEIARAEAERLAAEAAKAPEARQPDPDVIAEASQFKTPHGGAGQIVTTGFVFPEPPDLRTRR